MDEFDDQSLFAAETLRHGEFTYRADLFSA